MRQKFGLNSIIVKMIVIYSIPFILFSLVLIRLNHNSTERIQNEFITQMEFTFNQASDELETKLAVPYDLNDVVVKNIKLLEFMDDPYLDDQSEFLSYYLDGIVPIVKYATAFTESDDYTIRVFMKNENIPESWPYFLHLRQQEQHPSIQSFLNDETKSYIWLAPDEVPNSPSQLSMNRNVYTLVSKLYSSTRNLLGIVTIMIAEDYLLQSNDHVNENENVQFLLNDTGIIHATTSVNNEEQFSIIAPHLKDEQGHFIDDQHLYFYKQLKELDQYFVLKSSLHQLNTSTKNSVVNQVLIMLASLILLIITCLVMVKMIFLRLNRMISVMKKVMSGDINRRIPDTNRDELGQIAQDFNNLIDMNNELIHNVVMKERLRKEAQIQALQYQINPHFIYNTLDIFRMRFIKEKMFDIADSLADFGKILRYNLSEQTHQSTLGEEIELIKKYMSLQKISTSQRISLQVKMDDTLKTYPVIKFLLQPIVENSIKYGKLKAQEQLEVNITIEIQKHELWIQVEDNGNGMSEQKLEALNQQFQLPLQPEGVKRSSSIGLQNINSRLRLYYGDVYYLTVQSKQHEYTKILIKIPYE
ncbi:sensor histidine kinase [Paenibacillus endoradicis]|uniref:sensor histidine kinase n=1 Tax=Paenibacillus endoradicis TaxID=2972487 RepID=UPI0021599F70|nr:histidine kinase [Paenibacillus endoradicis]MCR8659990.1 histidine kinase [Paenibacillus endoradicis]